MRKLLNITYDGTAYHGWQVQSNALTVQEVMQNAIEKVFGSRLDLSGTSRTDTGVHANMYCCHFDTGSGISNQSIVRALNANLPFDIAVQNCEDVPDDFHARYSATAKEYIYKIHNARQRDPFLYKYSLHITHTIKVDIMQQAVQHLVGTRDFAAFCNTGSDIGDTVRTVKYAGFERQGDMITFKICADGFLYNMVRIIVGTMLFVNNGRIAPDGVPDILASKDRKNAGGTAPAKGLYLNKVVY